MDLLRRHLFLIICGVAGIGGMALALTGMRAMPAVQKKLEERSATYRSIESLQSNPVNRERIEAEQRRIETILTDHRRVMERARQLYNYEQLIPNVLPYGTPVDRLRFRDKYGEAMRELLASTTGGAPASAAEVDQWRKRIDEEQLARTAGGPVGAAEPLMTAAGVLTAAGVKQDPQARAHLAAAQRVYCYVTDFTPKKPGGQDPSLDFDPIMADTTSAVPPFPADVWNAQIGYWIQKDVVEAIVAVNAEAAKRAQDAGRSAWVGTMPVKEIISVRLSLGVVPPDGDIFVGAAPGGYEQALPPGTPATAFTRHGSGPFYEVVQFSVKLVMDQRDIPLLVERICNNRFHTLLRVAYDAVPENRKFSGKVYGSEPAVNVVMDFETILLGEVFRRLMPQFTRDTYGVQCRDVDECQPEP
jgi:hypothetical protein